MFQIEVSPVTVLRQKMSAVASALKSPITAGSHGAGTVGTTTLVKVAPFMYQKEFRPEDTLRQNTSPRPSALLSRRTDVLRTVTMAALLLTAFALQPVIRTQ
jgi:hypothetical protein